MFVAKSPVDDSDLGAHGVDLVSVASYNANKVIEDRYAGHVTGNKVMTTVFDGHGGWQTAEYARQNLGKNFVTELESHTKDGQQDDVTKVTQALTRAFLRTDRELMGKMLTAYNLGFYEVNHVGACVCSVVTYEDQLIVANAGDCRAVLGRARGGPESATAIALTNDHNARIKSEQLRLASEHPGEIDIVRCKSETACYVKGRLQPTRCLGDFYLKNSEFNTPVQPPPKGLRVRQIRPPYTPPYITANPEITTRKLDLTKDSFVIIGSDGLWDFVTNEEAVKVVAEDKGDRRTVAARLAEHALRRAAHDRQITFDQLLNFLGRRRSVYDDITVAVVFLDRPEVRVQRIKDEEAAATARPRNRPDGSGGPGSSGGRGFFSWLFGRKE